MTVALYHLVGEDDTFDESALRLFELVKTAQREHPDEPRTLLVDVDGHRNSEGGFDHSTYELLTYFIVGFLGSFLTEISTPLGHMTKEADDPQRNDVPDVLAVQEP